MISAFREDYIFTKLHICEVSRKQNPRENFGINSTSKVKPLHTEITSLTEIEMNGWLDKYKASLFDPESHHPMYGVQYFT